MAAVNTSAPPDKRNRAGRRRKATGRQRREARESCDYTSPQPLDLSIEGRSEGPECGYISAVDDLVCTESGWHYCEGRADRAVAFIQDILVHTKGRHARRPFDLAEWQSVDVIRPIFGEVRWSAEQDRYVRRFTTVWIEVARKNGKSELLAALALIMLVGDDEEGGEIYGCALDIPQARKVFDVAARMVELSPLLSARLNIAKVARRIVDPDTNSYYEVVPADAAGNLGHNPSAVVFDEVLTQPDGDLWDALRTGMGTRSEPLMVAATTAGADPNGFCSDEHAYGLRVLADPELDPYRFVYLRNVPADADPFDEDVWHLANPALGDFLSLELMRQEAKEARNEPRKLLAFKLYRLNQWVEAGSRWITPQRWDSNPAAVPAELEADLVGARAFGGLDLASTSDLVALAWCFPEGRPDQSTSSTRWIWRHFAPEAMLDELDDMTAGKARLWVDDGWLKLTAGDFVDYDAIHEVLTDDLESFAVESFGVDRWNSAATTTWLAKEFPKVETSLVGQGYASTTEPMKLAEQLLAGPARFEHGGNPLARWCFTSCDVKEDEHGNIKPMKPRRKRARYRIDTVPASAMALDGWLRKPEPKRRKGAAGF